jgi:tetratricopeptide (TPR) repeat protein
VCEKRKNILCEQLQPNPNMVSNCITVISNTFILLPYMDISLTLLFYLDSFSLFRYAQFLEKCGDLETAEDYYLMALEADPNNAGCLHCYGNFLSERGLEEEAESFYLRSSKNTIGQKYMPEYYY